MLFIVVPSLADVDLADILAVVVAAAVDVWGNFSFLFSHLYLAVNVYFSLFFSFLQCSLEQ